MAIIVTLKASSTGTSYNLRAEEVTHTFVRLPAQAPYASSAVGYAGGIFTLDLGMLTEQIAVIGVLNTFSSGSNDPSVSDISTVCRTWWSYGADDPTVLPILTIPGGSATGESYYVHIKQGEFRVQGALEDRWQMSLLFYVSRKL